MNVLIVVMVHNEPAALATYARHRKLWERPGHPILTYTTADTPKKFIPGDVVAFGSKEHHGAASLDRFRFLIRHLNAYEAHHDFFLIHEYDSVMLSKSIPSELTDWGAIFSNLHHERAGTKFVGTRFMHPPLFMNREILARFSDACRHEDESGLGFWDRYAGRICELDLIPMFGFGRLGFSVNTIHQAHLPAAVGAVKNGCVMLHGVKDEPTLNALLAAQE